MITIYHHYYYYDVGFEVMYVSRRLLVSCCVHLLIYWCFKITFLPFSIKNFEKTNKLYGIVTISIAASH